MKIITRILPTLLLVALAWTLMKFSRPATPASRQQLDELHHQLDELSTRLSILESQSNHSAPRGGISAVAHRPLAPKEVSHA